MTPSVNPAVPVTGIQPLAEANKLGAVLMQLPIFIKPQEQSREYLLKSKELLKVSFGKSADKFRDVWLEGKAKIVYGGIYYV